MEEIYIILGVLTTISGIISTLLNPISFYYHFIKRSTTSARLYCLLAAADFATNLIFPFFLAYRFFSDRPQDNIGFRSVSTTETMVLTIFDVPAFITGVIVSTIAIVRFIAVKYPLYIVRNKALFCFMITAFLFFITHFMLVALSDNLKWCPMYEFGTSHEPRLVTTYDKVNMMMNLSGVTIYMGLSILGGISSVGTIILVLIRKVHRKSLTQNTATTNINSFFSLRSNRS